MSRRQKGHRVPEPKTREFAWWGERHTAPPHVWTSVLNDGVFTVSCSECDAVVRIEVGEDDRQVVLVGIVMNAGSGVRSDQVDWICDRLFEDMKQRHITFEQRRALDGMNLDLTKLA